MDLVHNLEGKRERHRENEREKEVERRRSAEVLEEPASALLDIVTSKWWSARIVDEVRW